MSFGTQRLSSTCSEGLGSAPVPSREEKHYKILPDASRKRWADIVDSDEEDAFNTRGLDAETPNASISERIISPSASTTRGATTPASTISPKASTTLGAATPVSAISPSASRTLGAAMPLNAYSDLGNDGFVQGSGQAIAKAKFEISPSSTTPIAELSSCVKADSCTANCVQARFDETVGSKVSKDRENNCQGTSKRSGNTSQKKICHHGKSASFVGCTSDSKIPSCSERTVPRGTATGDAKVWKSKREPRSQLRVARPVGDVIKLWCAWLPWMISSVGSVINLWCAWLQWMTSSVRQRLGLAAFVLVSLIIFGGQSLLTPTPPTLQIAAPRFSDRRLNGPARTCQPPMSIPAWTRPQPCNCKDEFCGR